MKETPLGKGESNIPLLDMSQPTSRRQTQLHLIQPQQTANSQYQWCHEENDLRGRVVNDDHSISIVSDRSDLGSSGSIAPVCRCVGF